jgi:hypothetical protein
MGSDSGKVEADPRIVFFLAHLGEIFQCFRSPPLPLSAAHWLRHALDPVLRLVAGESTGSLALCAVHDVFVCL